MVSPSRHLRTRPMMTADALDRAARIIRDARVGNHVIDALPEDCKPETLADGYAVQERLLRLLKTPAVGWLLALTNPAMQRIYHSDVPYYGRVLGPNLYWSPQHLDSEKLLTIILECEVAFQMAADLPPRSIQYSVDEVAEAVATMHASVEVPNSNFKNPFSLPLPTVVADNGIDGPLVCSAGLRDWRRINRSSMPISLRINNKVVTEGVGGNAMGDPLKALTWLANELRKKQQGLKRGEIIDTGVCTEAIEGSPGDEVHAIFGELGEVRITLSPRKRA